MRKTVIAVVAGFATATIAFADPAPSNTSTKRIEITITKRGFEPDLIQVKKGESVTLAFTRKTDATCAKQIVIDTGDGKTIQKVLPLGQVVETSLTFSKTGELTYACSMNMVKGRLIVQ